VLELAAVEQLPGHGAVEAELGEAVRLAAVRRDEGDPRRERRDLADPHWSNSLVKQTGQILVKALIVAHPALSETASRDSPETPAGLQGAA
jgi:hypothetical protein